MVLAILAATTEPTFSFLLPVGLASVGFASVLLVSVMVSLPALLAQFPLAQHGQHPRPILPQRPGFLQTVHLSHGHLEPQPEHLLPAIAQRLLQFGLVETARFVRILFHFVGSIFKNSGFKNSGFKNSGPTDTRSRAKPAWS